MHADSEPLRALFLHAVRTTEQCCWRSATTGIGNAAAVSAVYLQPALQAPPTLAMAVLHVEKLAYLAPPAMPPVIRALQAHHQHPAAVREFGVL